jgi:hypothetical protein
VTAAQVQTCPACWGILDDTERMVATATLLAVKLQRLTVLHVFRRLLQRLDGSGDAALAACWNSIVAARRA